MSEVHAENAKHPRLVPGLVLSGEVQMSTLKPGSGLVLSNPRALEETHRDGGDRPKIPAWASLGILGSAQHLWNNLSQNPT